jgi:hypothetical protein
LRFPLALALVLTTSSAFGAPPPGATVIVSRSETYTGGWYVTPVQYASWTQTGTFSGVTIQANLLSTGGTATGNAYLTTHIGPGTTTAQQIGAAVPISLSNTTPAPVTLFSGLTLGPGTYYLTIERQSNLAWECCGTSVVTVTAPGVTANSDYLVGTIDTYRPASTFFSKGQIFIYSAFSNIVAAAVPALSPFAMGTAALLLLSSGLLLLRRYLPQA